MKRSAPIITAIVSCSMLLIAPTVASADVFNAVGVPDTVGINSMWVFVAACLVLFMQAGFALLEIGFSRGKNAGTIVAKILTNFSIAAILYWAVGFAFAFGGVENTLSTWFQF
jgi:Amt family ammonium transporter